MTQEELDRWAERNQKLWAMRKGGMIFRELGRAFGISTDRARKICVKLEHRERQRQAREVRWDQIWTPEDQWREDSR